MTDTGFKRFLRYCIVGVAGFCTDGGLLQLGIHLFGLGVIVARVPSFTVAVLVTWYLNRGFTFRMQSKSFQKSFPTYIAANAVGLAINFGTYSAGVLFSPFLAQYPLIPLAVGAGIGMVFNFFAARWIFRAG